MHVEPKPISDYPWLIRLFFWKQKRTYGQVLDPGLIWGRSPWVFAGVALLFGALSRRGSPIPPALRALVTVRISQINHCAFCVDINSATLVKVGVSDDKIMALPEWRTSDLFDEAEKVALIYAEAVTHTDGIVDAAMMTRLKEHFSDDALVDLTGLIAFQNMSSKFNGALDIPAQGFCRIPPPPVA